MQIENMLDRQRISSLPWAIALQSGFSYFELKIERITEKIALRK